MIAPRLLASMIELHERERSACMNLLNDRCQSMRHLRKIAGESVFIRHIGGMDTMLLQHNHASSSHRSRSIIVSMLQTEQIVPGQIGGMAPEDDPVTHLSGANH